MSEQDAALHAFEEWWSITGSKQLAAQRNHGGCEYSAFVAGAEWQRERDACVAERIGAAPKVRDGRPDEATQIAREIRKGDA